MEQKNKLIYMGILLEKATDTRHVAHTQKNKLILREILLEKATDTGHVAHQKNKLIYREILFKKATYTRHLSPKVDSGDRSALYSDHNYKRNPL